MLSNIANEPLKKKRFFNTHLKIKETLDHIENSVISVEKKLLKKQKNS